MSKLGKIFLIIAVIGGIAAAVAGGLLIEKRGEDKTQVDQAQQAKRDSDKKVVDVTQKLKDVTDAKAKEDSDLTTAQSKVEDLSNQLTTAKKTAEDATALVDKANAAAKDAQAKVDDMTAQLGGKTPADYKADVDKAQKDLAAAQAEQKIVEDQAQSLKQQVADLNDAINRSKTGKMPPGVSGKVTFVDRTWNFVVLDVGLSAGVVPNGELIVYRGKNFLGKVRVTKADPNDSVAEILPDIKGDIQVGDYVLN